MEAMMLALVGTVLVFIFVLFVLALIGAVSLIRKIL